MEKLIYLNGLLFPESDAKISVFDYGLLYGYGLFETMRAYNGKVFRIDQHIDRLLKSAKLIEIPIIQTRKEIKNAIDLTLATNNLNDAHIRITFTYGKGLPRLQFSDNQKTNLIVIADRIPENISKIQKEGIRAIISQVARRNNHSVSSKIKSTNFLDSILAKIEVRAKKADDAILLNSDNFVSEATTSNVFIVSDKKLITPSEDSGILLGITRNTITEISKDIGIIIEQKKLTTKELIKADECFITNSIMEIVPVVEIEGKKIGDGKPGEMTKRLQEEYKKLVEKETKK